MTFDFDEWPGNHSNEEECVRFYNESFFHLRHHYSTIYHEDSFSLKELYEENLDSSHAKVYKIKYSINLLPQAGFYINNDGEHFNEEVSLMALAADSEEIEIFQTASLINLINFKWLSYGKRHHMVGCMMHLFYTFVFIVYVFQVQLYEQDEKYHKYYAGLLLVGITYPAIYDFK